MQDIKITSVPGDRKIQLKQYFESLKLNDWSITGNAGKGGQAEIIEVKNKKTGELGVFRTLRRRNEQDIARFFRELDILVKINHPNIIRIIECTKDKDHQWYISKKGIRFEEQWKSFYNANYSNPDSILERAIGILKGLTDGLVDLHKIGIVHRDIKAKNIVLDGSIPVLIDFGIAFVAGEERLTPIDEAVGNIYSPDPSLNFMENVPPWLDIFLLSQLLIWMVSEGTSKPHIQRPLDWRWVVYPGFSNLNILKVRALTSLCSNYFTAPKDASEFKTLLIRLFDEKELGGRGQPLKNMTEIKEVIVKGLSNQMIHFSEAHSIIESRLMMFRSICKELEEGISDLADELNELEISMNERGSVDDFIKKFSDHTPGVLAPVYQTIFNYLVGHGPQTFGFGFSYVLYTKRGIEASPQFREVENIPIIAFTLNGSNDKLARNGKTKSYYIIPYDNGVLQLSDGHSLQKIRDVTIRDVLNLVRQSIVDKNVWEILYS